MKQWMLIRTSQGWVGPSSALAKVKRTKILSVWDKWKSSSIWWWKLKIKMEQIEANEKYSILVFKEQSNKLPG